MLKLLWHMLGLPFGVRTALGIAGAKTQDGNREISRDPAPVAQGRVSLRRFAGPVVYERMLDQGVAKEVARSVLPLAMYTKYFWSCNPRSLMHFCSLRNSEHAQHEIHEYARAAEGFLEQLMPVTHAAFGANGRAAP